MSTHGTVFWLEIKERNGGRATVEVAEDIGVDLCVRLSVGERGVPGAREAHLNLEQAADVGLAILETVRRMREMGIDPAWAAETV